MRKSRNGLRPVTAEIRRKENGYQQEFVPGYLIAFHHEGSIEEGISLYAAVELEDGSVLQVDAFKVKFDDVEVSA